MDAVLSAAFANAPAATVKSLTGDEIAVRPQYDPRTGRLVVELAAAGFKVQLDNGSIVKLISNATIAAKLGEVANVAAGVPTPYGKPRS